MAPGGGGGGDRARPPARRDQQQHGVRDLAQALLETAHDELVAGVAQDRDRGGGLLERVELGVDEAIDRRRRHRQVGEQRGGAIARAAAAPRDRREQLAGGGRTERRQRVLGGGAHVVVGLAERARDAAEIVGIDRVGAFEQRAVHAKRRGDLRRFVAALPRR